MCENNVRSRCGAHHQSSSQNIWGLCTFIWSWPVTSITGFKGSESEPPWYLLSPCVCVCVCAGWVQAGLSGFKARAPVLCVWVSGFGRPPLSRTAYLWPEPSPVRQPETEWRGGIECCITPVHSYAHKTWLTHIGAQHTHRLTTDKEMEISPMISYQRPWVLGCRVRLPPLSANTPSVHSGLSFWLNPESF